MGLWLKQDDGTLAEVSGGADGADGADGVDGQPGVDGATWHVGSGNPAPTLGSPGDYYLDGDAGWVWVKRTDTSWTNLYVNLTGPPGEGAGEHDHDYLPLSGGTLTGDLQVDGTATAALFSIPTNDAANATMKTYTANGYQLMQLQVSTANTIEIAGPDSSQRPNTVSISSGGGVAARFDPNQDTRLYGDLQVDSDVWVGFRIKSEYTRDNPTASGATNVHLSDNGYFYKTTVTRGGPFTPSKLARSEDVLVKAETATLPPEMETDDGGNILNTAEIEAHDTVQLFDVVTALVAKVKELSARIEALEAAG